VLNVKKGLRSEPSQEFVDLIQFQNKRVRELTTLEGADLSNSFQTQDKRLECPLRKAGVLGEGLSIDSAPI